MRWMLFLVAVATLGISGFAAWFFFGGPEDDPARIRHAAHVAEIAALKPRADAGEVMAQMELAKLYRDDRFDTRNPHAAFQLFSDAARRGNAEAQYFVGTMYAAGEGVGRDYFRAAEWYRLASRMGGNADAELALGDLHFHGRGAPHDVAEAAQWYRKAARKGHPVAQYRLGALIEDGYAGAGGPPDPVRSYIWFGLAVRHAARLKALDPPLDPMAAKARVAERMTEDQLKRAEAAVRARRPPE